MKECPLGCNKKFYKKDDAIKHQNQCENNFEKCLNC